jgi:hypothetical protein
MNASKRILVAAGAAWLLAASLARAEFTPIAAWDRQLFPSYVIATASCRQAPLPADAMPAERLLAERTLGEPAGLLGVVVKSPAAGTPVRVTLECPEFWEPSTFVGTLPEAGTTYRIQPKIRYHFDRLAQCVQAAPASVRYRVALGDAPEEEQIVTLTVRSVNDCPIAVGRGDDELDVSFTFAAYVNEQHPFVEKLLGEALEFEVVDAFTGYQTGDDDEVLRQVYSLWDLLAARELSYSDVATSAVESEFLAGQHVRLLEETVNNGQANCVDGSVLMVSLLRRIGIDAFLVLEPRHCYVGFYADAAHRRRFALETTLLGEELTADDVKVSSYVERAIETDLRDEASYYDFAEALHKATAKFEKSAPKFADPSRPEYRLVDVAAARRDGVLPIPFLGKEQFVDYDFTDYYKSLEAENQ